MKVLRQSIFNTCENCIFYGLYTYGEAGVDKTIEFKNKYTESGIVFHKVMEVAHKKPLPDLHKMIDELMNETDFKVYENDFHTIRLSLHDQLDWAYKEGKCKNRPDIIATEFDFEIENFIDSINMPFKGTIDRVVGTLETRNVILEDWKTGAIYSPKEMSNNIQATIYSIAWYKLYGYFPKKFRFYFTKHKKVKEIKIDNKFINRGVERILNIYLDIKAGTMEEARKRATKTFYCYKFCMIDDEKCPIKKKLIKKKPQKFGRHVLRIGR